MQFIMGIPPMDPIRLWMYNLHSNNITIDSWSDVTVTIGKIANYLKARRFKVAVLRKRTALDSLIAVTRGRGQADVVKEMTRIKSEHIGILTPLDENGEYLDYESVMIIPKNEDDNICDRFLVSDMGRIEKV